LKGEPNGPHQLRGGRAEAVPPDDAPVNRGRSVWGPS